MSAVFSDSIDANLDLLEELVRGLPSGQRNQARLAANLIEKVFNDIRRDSQGNPGAAIGTAWAVYKIAKEMVQKSENGIDNGKKLIQLVN